MPVAGPQALAGSGRPARKLHTGSHALGLGTEAAGVANRKPEWELHRRECNAPAACCEASGSEGLKRSAKAPHRNPGGTGQEALRKTVHVSSDRWPAQLRRQKNLGKEHASPRDILPRPQAPAFLSHPWFVTDLGPYAILFCLSVFSPIRGQTTEGRESECLSILSLMSGTGCSVPPC